MLRVYVRGFLQKTVGSPDAAHARKLRDGLGKTVRALAEADTFYLLFGELSRPLEEEILHRFGERCIFIFIPENADDLLHFRKISEFTKAGAHSCTDPVPDIFCIFRFQAVTARMQYKFIVHWKPPGYPPSEVSNNFSR